MAWFAFQVVGYNFVNMMLWLESKKKEMQK
jgi:hypothetical protein